MGPFFGTLLLILTKPIQANRPDIIIKDKRRSLIDLIINVYNKMSAEISKKRSKCKDLEI